MFERIIGESIGTCIFALIITAASVGTEFTGNYQHQFSVGGGAIILIMLAGFSSEPHLNPAITFGHYIRDLLYKGFDKQSLTEHLLIILVQFVSAFPGAYIGWGLNTSLIYFAPTSEAKVSQAFIAELVYTTLIVATALMVGKTKDSRILASVGVGAAYFSGVLCVSYYSGACFNPALGLAVNIVKYTQNQHHLEHTWIYILAPLTGGLIGGLLNSVFIIGAPTNDENTLLRES